MTEDKSVGIGGKGAKSPRLATIPDVIVGKGLAVGCQSARIAIRRTRRATPPRRRHARSDTAIPWVPVKRLTSAGLCARHALETGMEHEEASMGEGRW